MADVTISIPIPILQVGETFDVAYRLFGSPTWIDISPKTNTPFTITGLSAGLYELRYALRKGVSDLCPYGYRQFRVNADASYCIGITSVTITSVNGQRFMNIAFTPPAVLAPCGYVFKYGPVGNPSYLPYLTLPPSPIVLPVPNASTYHLYVDAQLCSGLLEVCYDEDVSYSEPPCTPITITSADIVFNNGWYITLVITQPTPPHSPFTIQYQQTNPLTTGAPNTGVASSNTTGTTITFPINPNMNTANAYLEYQGTINDGCSGILNFNCSLLIT